MGKKAIGAGAAALLAGLAAGTIYWQKTGTIGLSHAKSGPSGTTTLASPKLVYVDVNELTLRLSDTSMEHYIKLTPVLAVRSDRADDFSEREAVVRDRIISIVSGRSSVELTTPQGEAQLKRDIIQSLRHEFGNEVIDVYFSGYLVE
jgi:flagellar basal body-associated protein FliL